MTPALKWPVALIAGALLFVGSVEVGRNIAFAQTRKRVVITRIYTGSDNQTHTEDIEVPFTPTSGRDVGQLMKITGAELRRTPPGTVQDWHNAPRRQYVITLSGRGEIEVAGGKRIVSEPGHIELAEDLTGKGHITRVIGSEDRITLTLPLVDPSTK